MGTFSRNKQISWKATGIAVTLFLILLSGVSAKPQKHYVYKRTVELREILLSGPKSCVWVQPSMSSEFFDKLKWTKTDQGIQFRKKNRLVSTFPSEFLLSVRFGAYPCAVNNWASLRREDADEWLQPMHFEVAWKRNLEIRSITLLSPFVLSMNPQPVQMLRSLVTSGRENQTVRGFVWEFTARAASQDVPLTDGIELSLFEAHGKLLGRTVLRLDTPPPALKCCS